MSSCPQSRAPPLDTERACELFHADGFVRFDANGVNDDPTLPSRVVCAIWAEYTKTLCKALVRHEMRRSLRLNMSLRHPRDSRPSCMVSPQRREHNSLAHRSDF